MRCKFTNKLQNSQVFPRFYVKTLHSEAPNLHKYAYYLSHVHTSCAEVDIISCTNLHFRITIRTFAHQTPIRLWNNKNVTGISTTSIANM